MKVRLRKGSHVKNDAETIHVELERVKEKHGGDLTPQAVVDESKPKDAPLHNEFEWHNPTAANEYRKIQGRKVIQSVEIVREERPTTRVYESVTIEKANGGEPPVEKKVFRSTDEILADPDMRAELLIRAMREATAFRKRYAGLQELAQIIHAIDNFVVGLDS